MTEWRAGLVPLVEFGLGWLAAAAGARVDLAALARDPRTTQPGAARAGLALLVIGAAWGAALPVDGRHPVAGEPLLLLGVPAALLLLGVATVGRAPGRGEVFTLTLGLIGLAVGLSSAFHLPVAVVCALVAFGIRNAPATARSSFGAILLRGERPLYLGLLVLLGLQGPLDEPRAWALAGIFLAGQLAGAVRAGTLALGLRPSLRAQLEAVRQLGPAQLLGVAGVSSVYLPDPPITFRWAVHMVVVTAIAVEVITSEVAERTGEGPPRGAPPDF